MKYRYAARYTEFVKQRKERILSALLVPRSSLRRNGKRDGERWQPLDSRPAVPGWAAFCPLTPSPPLVCSLSACNVYLPTFRGDTFPTRWLQLTMTSDLINNPGGARIKCFARATRFKVKFNFWPLPEPEGASGANSLASREIPVRQLMADIHQTRSLGCSHGVNEPYEHGDGYRLACEQRWGSNKAFAQHILCLCCTFNGRVTKLIRKPHLPPKEAKWKIDIFAAAVRKCNRCIVITAASSPKLSVRVRSGQAWGKLFWSSCWHCAVAIKKTHG